MACSSPPKRAKLSSYAHLAAAASAVFADEPALLELIVSYLPGTTSNSSNDTEKNNGASNVLQTIVSLCHAVPGLGSRLSPANDHFWRALVLSQFDFTIDDTKVFNVKNYGEIHGIAISHMMKEDLDEKDYVDWVETNNNNNNDSAHDGATKKMWDYHPAHAAINQYNSKHGDAAYPRVLLANDLAFWPNIGAYFRPHEYKFLSEIQSGKEPSMSSSWPAHEDAFTLYCDLVMVVEKMATLCCQTGGYDDLHTSSDGFAPLCPVLLGRLDAPLTKRGFELLRHLDFLPHFWWRAPRARWTGFDGPQPSWTAKPRPIESDDEEDDEDEDEVEEEEEEEESDGMDCRVDDETKVFPSTYSRSFFESLKRTVYDSFSDWRTVYENFEEDPSPQFYVGPTKRSGRWIGFVGERQYY